MAVSGAMRRRGVARTLLARCERVAALWRYPDVLLHVDVGNVPAETLYRQTGYERVRQDPWWFGLPRRYVLTKPLVLPEYRLRDN
jgi:ribosomal protein S18 acetylase RimI-like enzyme